MTSAEVWAVIAALALAGWGWSNWTVMRALVPNASAFNILEKLNARQDDQVREVVDRVLKRTGGVLPGPTKAAPTQSRRQPEIDQLERAFGGTPMEPIDEQPDASDSVEIVEGA